MRSVRRVDVCIVSTTADDQRADQLGRSRPGFAPQGCTRVARASPGGEPDRLTDPRSCYAPVHFGPEAVGHVGERVEGDDWEA